jgi:hypothetical protein
VGDPDDENTSRPESITGGFPGFLSEATFLRDQPEGKLFFPEALE